MDAIFWKFVKIGNDKHNHKHSSTLYFGNSSSNNNNNNKNSPNLRSKASPSASPNASPNISPNTSPRGSPNLSPLSAPLNSSPNSSIGMSTASATSATSATSGSSGINSLHARQSSNASVDSVGSGISIDSGSMITPSMESHGSEASLDSIGNISNLSSKSGKSENNKQWGAIRAVCTRDRDTANPNLGYIVFELPLDLEYFRVARPQANNNNNNNSSNKYGKMSVPSIAASMSATNVISGNGKYPKLSKKQLASWTVEDVQQWMKYVCKMRQLSQFKKLEQRKINGMKLLSCVFNHDNNVHYKVFNTKSVQVLTGVIDRKLAEKIAKKLDELITRQKEKIRMNSITFGSLYKYINDPMKAMIKHKYGSRMRRNSIDRNAAERRRMKRTLSKMDTKLHQSHTALIVYHDTKDSTSDIMDEKELYAIESATDVDTDGDYHDDDDDDLQTPPLPGSKLPQNNKDGNVTSRKKRNKKKMKKSVRFAASVGSEAEDSDDSKSSNSSSSDNENDNDKSSKIRSPIISVSLHASQDSKNSVSSSSGNSINSLPMDDKEYRDENKNSNDNDNENDKKRRQKKPKHRRPQTAGGAKSHVKRRKRKGNKIKSKAHLKHNRSKTAKFYKNTLNGKEEDPHVGSANKMFPKAKRKQHRQMNKTWTSVKDVFNEDMSAKSKAFAKKKQFLMDIGAIDETQAMGRVPSMYVFLFIFF